MRNVISVLSPAKPADPGKGGGGTITIKITSDVVFRV